MIDREIGYLISTSLADEDGENWNLDSLLAAVSALFPLSPDVNKDNLARMSRSEIEERLLHYAGSLYDKREQEIGADNMRVLERLVMLRAIDTRWIDHLTALDDMRRGIGLQAYAQRDPLIAYKKEAHEMFQDLQAGIQHDIVRTIYHVGIPKEAPQLVGSRQSGGRGTPDSRLQTPDSGMRKVGRNEPCPCGSGKKYKKCCGR
ncbi:MAG: Protein translocase subunit SecA [Chloroflexi bacterium]|nr:Protein translocase subunit SecA [Chloroflexota bacterium]